MADYISQYTGAQIDEAVGRALPDGAIDQLLSDTAPSGYGSGERPKVITDPDTWRLNGEFNFWASGNAENTIEGFQAGIIKYRLQNEQQVSGSGTQDFFPSNTSYHLRREYKGGVWYPWEWLNPPMQLGVEYRTTERYLGKPVYTKCVNFSGLPNNTIKEVSVSTPNKDVTVRYFVSSSSSHVHPSKFISEFYFSDSAMIITTNADASMFATNVTVFYTKTTG